MDLLFGIFLDVFLAGFLFTERSKNHVFLVQFKDEILKCVDSHFAFIPFEGSPEKKYIEVSVVHEEIKCQLLLKKGLLNVVQQFLHFLNYGCLRSILGLHASVPPEDNILLILHVLGTNFKPDGHTFNLPMIELPSRTVVVSIITFKK